MAYPLQTMSCDNDRTIGISKRTILLLAAFGLGLGFLLGSLGVPRWAYFAAPLAAMPLLIYELRRAMAEQDRRRSRGHL
jgi:polyferredoxin